MKADFTWTESSNCSMNWPTNQPIVTKDRASYPSDPIDNDVHSEKVHCKLIRAEQFKHITEVKRVRKVTTWKMKKHCQMQTDSLGLYLCPFQIVSFMLLLSNTTIPFNWNCKHHSKILNTMQYWSWQNLHARQRTTSWPLNMVKVVIEMRHNTIFSKEQIQPTTESLHKQATTESRKVFN